jgi:hypothetical protein
MFKLDPISTSNLFTTVQIIVVIVGFVFAWKSLKAAQNSVAVAAGNLEKAGENVALATKNAQAQIINQMMVQGRDLQFKFMDIFLSGASIQELGSKQSQFTGTVIGYHAACFELRNVLEVPENVEKLLDADLRELMRESYVRKKWDEVKHLHSQRFIEHVDSLRGI